MNTEKEEDGDTLVRRVRGGPIYTYRLLYDPHGYPSVEVTAQDMHGVRIEKSGLFPRDGRLARQFLLLAARCAVSPYTLVEVYDEFLARYL